MLLAAGSLVAGLDDASGEPKLAPAEAVETAADALELEKPDELHVIRAGGGPDQATLLSGASVTLERSGGFALTTSTDAAGAYSFPGVPEGTYTGTARQDGCTGETREVVVAGPTTADFTLGSLTDAFGYSCGLEDAAFEEAADVLPITGDDVAGTIDLPFALFTFYGQTYTQAHVCTNGFLEFVGPAATTCPFGNAAIPSAARPNGAVYPLWDDLLVDAAASIRSELKGTAPDRRFVIEYRNVTFFGATTLRVDFNIVLHESGEILTQYRNVGAATRERGDSATLGIEDYTGTVAFQFSLNEAVLGAEPAVTSIRYRPPGSS